MKPIVIDAAAISELKEAISFHEAESAGLSTEVERETERAFLKLQAHPEHYPRSSRTGLRRHLAKRFHYFVYYRDYPDCIWIAAIAHASRRPHYWRARRPPV